MSLVANFMVRFLFYAQPHAEEVCRRSGAWGARRVGEDSIVQDCVRKLVALLHAPRAASRKDESFLLDYYRV